MGFQALFDFSDITDAIGFAAENGFGVLELNLGNVEFGRQLSLKRERVRAAARRNRVALAVHVLEGPSFFVPNPRTIRHIVAEHKRLLDSAAEAGVRNVVMHLGFEMHYGMDGKTMFIHDAFPGLLDRILTDALAELKSYARGRSRLCIENVGGFRFEFVRPILERLLGGSLGLCWDVGHTAILSNEKQRTEVEFFNRHRRSIFHSHLHDNHGERDEHLALGSGAVDFLPYLRTLVAADALLVFEVRPKEVALRCLEYFKDRIEPELVRTKSEPKAQSSEFRIRNSEPGRRT